ncbi:TPA: [protein-PII] uridylyltransferase [Neisseria gonorrhoeae]
MPENLSSALETFKQQRNAAEAHYLKANRVSVFFREYTAAVETLLAALWAEHFQNSALCLMAVGGFGRGEPYPCSDVDLAVVSPAPLSDGIQEQIARFIQTLWDCKLMPSVKSGSVDELCESVRDDITGDTAFLEARFLFGNRQTADELAEKMNVQRNVAAFIEAKLVEMEHRHAKSQGSGAVLEPNIKSCPGGLRDIHTLLWIAKAQGLAANLPDLLKQRILTRAEAGMLSHGYRRLAHIRIRLHLNAKRAEDRLLFDLQPQVAESMGYQDENRRRQSEELMRVFYRAVKTVKQLGGILTPMLRSRVSSTPMRVTLRIDDDYIQVNNQIAARHTDIFFRRPEHIFKIVEIMQQRNDITALEPQTLRAWWGATRKINRSFYQNSENRRRFAGFFRSGNGLTQTLRFLNLYGVLGRYLPAWEKIVGLLQHDLFHIYPVDDHILAVVRNVRRLALDMHSHELPYASALMQSFEKQDILYLAAFFHDIAKGRGGDHAVQGIADARQFAADHFLTEEESDLLAWLVENHLLMSAVAQKEDIQDPGVLDAFCKRVQTHERLSALYLLTISDIRGTNPKLWNAWRASLLESLFHAAGRCLAGNDGNPHALFSRHGFDILAARAFITEHDYILDTFIVQIPSQHAPEDYPDIQSALEAELNSFIHGHTVAETQSCNRRISRRSRYMPIAPSITITPEEDYPDRYSVEITAVNRPFLLADMAEVFFAHNVSLRYAKISTLDERVEDSFTVFSPDLKNPKIQSSLKQALLEQLA